jgi:hypothetical protein
LVNLSGLKAKTPLEAGFMPATKSVRGVVHVEAGFIPAKSKHKACFYTDAVLTAKS